MNKKLIPLLLASSTLLTGCLEDKNNNDSGANPAAVTAPAVAKEDAIAVVNGKYISKNTLAALEAEISQRMQGQAFPKDKLVEELIQRELLIQDALQKQLDKTPETIERLTEARNSLLTQAALQNFLKSNPITDAEIQAEYDSKLGSVGSEYKARHILVKTEDEAKALIAELDKGADFAEMAKTKSTGPSGPQGGDLGWFSPDRMVAPFSEAVIAMEDGQYTKEPVETQFGWHVILREESRAQTPPPLEEVKEQIRPMLQRQKVQSMMENLRSQASVEILIPLTEETPAAEAPATEESATEESATDDGDTAEPLTESDQAPEEEMVPESEETITE
jgi:peptidyl-prolyl cis-trans isomerase C